MKIERNSINIIMNSAANNAIATTIKTTMADALFLEKTKKSKTENRESNKYCTLHMQHNICKNEK